MDFIQKINNYNDAGHPALWINTYEEYRVTKTIKENCERPPTDSHPSGRKVWEWDCIDGLFFKNIEKGELNIRPDTKDLLVAFKEIEKICCTEGGHETLFLIKDVHLQFEKPVKRAELICGFKKLVIRLKARRSTVIFLAPNNKIPNELTKDIQGIDFLLPDIKILRNRLDWIISSVQKESSNVKKAKLILDEAILEAAAEAAQGLTASEAENAYAVAFVENKALNDGFVKTIFNEKVQIVKKSGLLTHIPTTIGFEQVGGLHNIKDWVNIRKLAYSKKARARKLPYPKGLVLTGIQGGGKTLIGKAIANELKCPLFQLDIGKLFSKLVGETEERFSELIKIIESLGKCVIMIDEAEKALSTSATSGQGDSGTSSRSFGTLLSWLSDRTGPAFMLLTTNNHLILPPELIRKGRFNEMFWVDLPTTLEREEIFKIIFQEYELDTTGFNLVDLAKATNGFTGAEIKNIFEDAQFAALADDNCLSMEYIIREIVKAEPQAKEKIAEIRKQIAGRMKLAADYDFKELKQ